MISWKLPGQIRPYLSILNISEGIPLTSTIEINLQAIPVSMILKDLTCHAKVFLQVLNSLLLKNWSQENQSTVAEKWSHN